MNFPMFKLDLEKAEEPEIKLPTSAGLSKKQDSSRKTYISALLTMPKPLPCFILYSKFACYSRYFLTFYFCIPVPYDEKDICFWC